MIVNSYIEYSHCYSTTTFWNKSLFTANIPEIYFKIDGIQYVVNYVFKKCLREHDRNMFTKIKTNSRNLRNMIETKKFTQEIYIFMVDSMLL